MIPAKYIDARAHICQADGDGGDSLNRIGCYFSCADITFADMRAYCVMMFYNNKSGRFCRNPEPGRWYSNYNNVTRDQMITLEAAWAILGEQTLARTHFALRIKRFMFHFNTEDNGYDSREGNGVLIPLRKTFPDAPSPVELTVIIRAGRYSFLRPLLYLLDIAFIVDVGITRRLNDRNLYDTDVQLLPAVLAGLKVWPTFWMKIAKWIYAKTDAAERLTEYYAEGEVYNDKGELIDRKNGIAPLGKIMSDAFRTQICGGK